MNKKADSDKTRKKIWLLYYNETLLRKGIISRTQYDKMIVKINQSCKG